MKKIVILGVAFLSLSLFLSQIAHAENVDARSVALGGTTLGVANGAFAPLRNPAAMVDIGWGSFILPLSPAINIGANTNTFNAFIPPVADGKEPPLNAMKNFANKLLEGFSKTPNARLEAQSIVSAFGFTGNPFANLSKQGNPFTFGVNVWIKATAFGNGSTSDGLDRTVLNGPSLFTSFTELQIQSNSLISLIRISPPDISKFINLDINNRTQVRAAAAEVEKFQANTLPPLINAFSILDKVNTDLKNILTDLDGLSKDQQSGKGDAVSDIHAVVALSGARRVYKNALIDLSVGVNLKGFFFPANLETSSVISTQAIAQNQLLGAVFSNPKFLPVTASTGDFKLGPYKSISEIKNILDNQISPILQEAKDPLDTAKELNQQLSDVLPKAIQGNLGITDIIGITGNISKLQSQATSIGQKINNNFYAQINSGLLSMFDDLKDVKFNINNISDVATLGVGVDLGLHARIKEDIILGLVLENPLVLWPAKMNTKQFSFDSEAAQKVLDALKAGKSTGPIQLGKYFKTTTTETKDTNYNLTEPMAIRFGGSYNLGKLTPYLTDAIILADIEQVFNGRPFAIHLGFEKGWMFGAAGIFGRLGGQIGGLGNVITMGIGFKGGPFNIDFGYGASNPFNPTGSNAATAALSTSLNF